MVLENEQKAIHALSQLLDHLKTLDAGSLAREELGPSLNFRQFVPIFARTLRLFKGLSECDLDTVPHQVLNKILNHASTTKAQFQAIQQFSLENSPSNPINSRDALANNIEGQYQAIFDLVSPIIAYSLRTGTDFGKLETQAGAMVEELGVLISNNEERVKQNLVEIEEIVKKVRHAAQDVGVTQHNLLFNDEAKEYQASANTWLMITGGLAIATLTAAIGLLFVYLWGDEKFTAKLQSLNLIALKVFIFGVLISATFWAGRIYRSHQHNYVVNKHRANALSTFETFVKGAGDDQTKSAVLLQSTQCIFSAQPSGYISQEPEGGMYKQILEIVRGDPASRH